MFRILLVEDDPEIGEFVAQGLREEWYVVEIAGDGHDGRHQLQTSTWDLVILDWWLPGPDGFVLLKEFRQASRTTPVLFLTARDAVAQRVEGLQAGAAGGVSGSARDKCLPWTLALFGIVISWAVILRQLMILAMVPLTLWSGTPQVACRCSTGEIRLFCPKLNQTQVADASTSCCASKAGREHSCCGTAKTAKCSACPSDLSRDSGSNCCSSGCACSRIVLSSELTPVPTKVQAPELVQCDWAVVSGFLRIQIPRVTRVDLSSVETVARVPDDLIVLCERWLI